MGQRWVVPVAIAVAGLVGVGAGPGGARVASAQVTAVERVPLAWDAPPACPSGEVVLAEVRRNLAEAGNGEAPFVAAVSVTQPPWGRWQASLRVETRGGRAERRFEAESCDAIASAAALIVALSADSGVGAGPAPAESLRSRAPVESLSATGAASSDDGWRRSGLSVTVDGVLDAGTMPDPSAGGIEAAVGPAWSIPGWRMRLLAGAGFYPTHRSANPYGTNADFWLATASVRGCVAAAPGYAEVGLCAGAELSTMHFSNPDDDLRLEGTTQYWLSPLVSSTAALPLSSTTTLFLRADVVVPSTRRSFHSDMALLPWNEYYQVPEVAIRGALGLELRFF